MKSIIRILLVVLTISVVSCKQNASDKVGDQDAVMARDKVKNSKLGFPEMTFKSDEYDFGTIDEGDVVDAEFEFTNTGKTDLVIMAANASCGCTVPSYPKDKIIKPGESEVIKARFKSLGKPNKQNKSVTLMTNTKEQTHKVFIKGFVNPKPNNNTLNH